MRPEVLHSVTDSTISIAELLDYVNKYFPDILPESVLKHYAEKYVECKAKDNMQSATKYKEMANDELKHAMYEHEWAVKEIEEISRVYTPPIEMQEKWDKSSPIL